MFLRALTCFVDSSKSTLCSLDGLHSPTMATPFAKDLLLTLGFTKHLVYPAEVLPIPLAKRQQTARYCKSILAKLWNSAL